MLCSWDIYEVEEQRLAGLSAQILSCSFGENPNLQDKIQAEQKSEAAVLCSWDIDKVAPYRLDISSELVCNLFNTL